jgi:hypothetical protein
MKRVHPFFFMIQRHDKKRRPRPHEVVDVWAMWNIGETLARLGYRLGGARINFPPPAAGALEPTDLARVDTSDCGPGDLILTTTRVPVGPEHWFKKQVPRGGTDLELELKEVWSLLVAISTRARVLLQEHLAALLPQGFENRFDMRFYQNAEGAPYSTLQARGEPSRQRYAGDELRTAAFLLHLPKLPRRECGYLGVWTPTGAMTVVWTELLRERHADLLRAPGFAMAELVGPPIPERQTDYRWTRDWRAEILLHVPATTDEPARRRPSKPARSSKRAA